MKKIFALVFTVLLAFSLIACGNTTVDSGIKTDSSASDSNGTENTASSDSYEQEISVDAKVLVAYFSRAGENYGVGVIEKGNTEIIAKMIAEKTSGDLFRIESVNAYPSGYDDCTEVAKKEKNSNARPGLTGSVTDFDDYDVIYLGYPIWWGEMPMPVYTFLESYDFSGKTIIPFCTHAGSGLSGTVSSIQTACSGATVRDGFAIAGTTAQTDRESAEKQVSDWLEK